MDLWILGGFTAFFRSIAHIDVFKSFTGFFFYGKIIFEEMIL